MGRAHLGLGLLVAALAAATCVEARDRDRQGGKIPIEHVMQEGIGFLQRGDSAGALRVFEVAVEMHPGHPAPHEFLANVLASTGRPLDAIGHYQQALQIGGPNPDVLYNMGLTMAQTGDLHGARRAWEETTALNPRNDEAWNNLGNLLAETDPLGDDPGLLDQALDALEEAVRLQPTRPEYHFNLGMARARRPGQRGAALGSLLRVLELAPGDVVAYKHATKLARDLRADDALDAPMGAVLEQVAASLPVDALYHAHLMTGDWEGLDAEFAAMVRAIEALGPEAPLSRLVSPNRALRYPLRPEQHLDIARRHSAPLAKAGAALRGELGLQGGGVGRAVGRSRLRVGYYSADMGGHVMSYLLQALYGWGNQSAVESWMYGVGGDRQSATWHNIQSLLGDRLVDLIGKSDAEIAQRIAGDGPSILCDANYDKGAGAPWAHNPVVAAGVAPLVVHFMGHPGTAGSGHHHYMANDRVAAPPSALTHMTEKMVYLPHHYLLNDLQRTYGHALDGDRGAWLQRLGLLAEEFHFANFGVASKIDPYAFDLWCGVLTRVPASRLLLVTSAEQPPETEDNLRAEARARGVNGDRLVFIPEVSPEEHLARLVAVDLYLDTVYYNSHTVTLDALWAGTPVVTLMGASQPARVAASALAAAGLQRLVAGSAKEYEDIATRLARG